MVVKGVWNSVVVVDGIDDDVVSQLVELDMSVECNHSSWRQIVVFAQRIVDTFAVVEVQRTQDDTSVVVVVVVVVDDDDVVLVVVQRRKQRMDGREDKKTEIDDGLLPL